MPPRASSCSRGRRMRRSSSRSPVWRCSRGRFWRGWGAIVRGELQLARAMFEDGVRFGRQISHRTSFAHSSAMLGKVLCKLGEYSEVEPVIVANGLSALTDGLWLDLLVRPESMKREQAWRITMSYLADAFPRHFQQSGLRARE